MQETKLKLLERIVDRRQDSLYRFAYIRTGSQADAEDIVQDVLLRLFHSDCNLDRIDDVERYLWRAIANRCCDYHRHRRNATLPTERAAALADDSGDQELREEYERIAGLLATLPEEQAEVIRLKTSDSLTFARIAEITGTAEVRREMLEHLETCPACAEFYRQTKAAFNAVAPRVEVQAPAGLKARILKTAAQAENTPATARTTAPARPRRLWLRPLSATLSAAALIALVLLVFDPVGRYRAHAAGRIFRDAAAQLDKSRSFRLEMNVRTLPQENFSYIDAEVPFVPHRMWVEPGSGRWRLEKAGRIALSDGERILMWSPEINSGFIMRPGSGAIEDFATLLDPYTLLLREELNFAERRNASYSKQVGPETITLTVEAPAEGDFSNDYLSGTSIDESDTRREYRFDRTTGRLIGLKIEQTDGKTPVTIAELQRIVYDIPLSDTLFRAYDGIEWIDLTKPVGGVHFAAIAPEEAARKLFAAMQTWDTEILAEGLVYYPLDLMKERYAGCRLLETQPAFRSGQYAGVFVPCRVKMSDGRIEKIVLALRNDNPTGSWVADGGL